MRISRRITALLLLPAALAAGPAIARAQGITEEQAQAILSELGQIRRLLEQMLQRQGPAAQRAPAPDQRLRVVVRGAPALGREDAPVTLVEFTDLECPFCRQFHVTTFEQIRRNFVDTGLVRFVTRDLPLDIHQHAMKAAHAARCAGEQDRFWEMRHALIVSARGLAPETLPDYARDLGLDVDRFRGCLDAERHGPAIQQDIAEARALGVNGTPTFVLGRSGPDAVEGVRIVGAQPYPAFAARIQELLPAKP
jgi:protein-disulfide isomerase